MAGIGERPILGRKFPRINRAVGNYIFNVKDSSLRIDHRRLKQKYFITKILVLVSDSGPPNSIRLGPNPKLTLN